MNNTYRQSALIATPRLVALACTPVEEMLTRCVTAPAEFADDGGRADHHAEYGPASNQPMDGSRY